MKSRPVALAVARSTVRAWHRHHQPPLGHLWSLGAFDDEDNLIGVVMVGRPCSRHLQEQGWYEVTRLVTNGTRNACSFLYAAAARRLRREARGARGLVTYILGSETGTSLRAAGWVEDVLRADSSARRGRTWSRGTGHVGGGVRGARRRFSITFKEEA